MTLYPVVILAGGLATRLRPVTETIPKSLIMIHDEPFVAYQLRWLKEQGISSVILCLGYLGEQVVQFVESCDWGLKIQYSFDGPTLQGTAGALKKALPLLQSDVFFVLYGDSYLLCDFSEVQATYVKSGKQGLMTVFKNEDQWDRSNVEFDGCNIIAYDKVHRTPAMHYIDYGLGILQQKVLKELPEQPYDLAKLYQTLLAQKELAGQVVRERFYEIGSFTGIEEFRYYAENFLHSRDTLCNSSNNF